MKIVDAKLGAEGSVTVDLSAGVLAISATENTPGASVSITASLPLTYYIDQGAQKLGSPLVQSIAGILDGVLKTLP